jgi:hypothetical protein
MARLHLFRKSVRSTCPAKWKFRWLINFSGHPVRRCGHAAVQLVARKLPKHFVPLIGNPTILSTH